MENELTQKLKMVRESTQQYKQIVKENTELKEKLRQELQSKIDSKNKKWKTSWGDNITLAIDDYNDDTVFRFAVQSIDSELINLFHYFGFKVEMYVEDEDILVYLL